MKKIGCISAPEEKFKNIKMFYFLQLVKFEKQSALCFVHFASGAQIKTFSKLEDGTLLKWSTENEELAKSQPLSKNWEI